MEKAELYNNLSPKLQSLYNGSDESCDVLEKISTTKQLSDEQHRNFVTTVGDVILGLIKIGDFGLALEKNIPTSSEIARSMVSELIEFFNPVLQENKEGSAKPHTIVAPTLPQAPVIKQTIPPLRTMEKDVDKVHGYGAYRELYPDAAAEPVHTSQQEETLRRLPVAPLPSYGQEESK